MTDFGEWVSVDAHAGPLFDQLRLQIIEGIRSGRLPAGTRLVANGVTLETESLLASQHAQRGGSLLRIDLAQAAPLGRMRGWDAARPVVQWSVTR